MIGIYKITSPTNRVYIGQSINIKRRFSDYKRTLAKSQPKLYYSFLKYGYENHIFEIIHECEIEELNDIERYYQILFNCVEHGLNCELVFEKIRESIYELQKRKNVINIIDNILFNL